MKNRELRQIIFKEFLPVCYEDIEPYLMIELERLREELMLLVDDTKEEILLAKFENSVKNRNEIDENESIRNRIDTDGREGLYEAFYKMIEVVVLDKDREYIDDWRKW